MINELPEVCDYIAGGILLINDDYKILDINRELALKAGVSKEFADGKNFLDFIPEEKRESITKMLENARNVGIERGIVNITVPSGKNFWVYTRVSKIDNGFVITVVDITRMIKEQRELVEKHDELEMVNEFVKEISGTLDIEKICEKAYCELLKVVTNMDAFIISLLDKDKGEIWGQAGCRSGSGCP